MNRLSAEDREEAHQLLNRILDIADKVHPRNEDCDVYRIPEAQRATRLFWLLYRNVLAWAEDIHRGHYLFEHEPWAKKHIEAFINDTAGSREDEDWFFEVVGGYLRINSGMDHLFDHGSLEDLSEHYWEGYNSTVGDQHVLYEMTQSTVYGMYFDHLHDATFQLQMGHTPELFRVTRQRRGNPWAMHWAKRQVTEAILFLSGRGESKQHAREAVGAAIGVSEHALKKWEVEIRKNGFVDFLCETAELAGTWSYQFANHDNLRSVEKWLGEDAPELQIRYGLSYLECAWHTYERYREIDYAKLRNLVRSARLGPTDT